MTISPAAVWRVRKAGSNTNGGGYDATISGAGTDYSQQDAAQLSLSDIACSNTTTVTSATGGFTSAMIGNAIYLTGGGATAAAYFITAVASSNSITIDRAPGTISAGSGKVGGAWADPWTNTQNHTNVQPGNTVYVRGSGTTTPATDDYSRSGFVTVSGDTVNGMIRFIGENGYPRIASNGLMFYSVTQLWLQNLYISTNGTNYASPYGVLNTSSAANYGGCYIVECKLDQNGKDIPMVTASWFILGSEVFSSVTPGSSGSLYALDGVSFGMQICFCNIHDTVGHGVRLSNHLGNHITQSIIAKCRGDGLTWDASAQGTDSGSNGAVNVTIDANSGDGVKFNGVQGLQEATIINCIISNHTGSGKYGMNASPVGTITLNNALKGYVDYNVYYGNTTDLNAISYGAHDVTGVNPQYSAQSTEGYNVGKNMKALGYPQAAFPQSLSGKTATQAYVDMGGVQRKEGAP